MPCVELWELKDIDFESMDQSLMDHKVENESNQASSADEDASYDSIFIPDADVLSDDEEIKEEVVPLHVI